MREPSGSSIHDMFSMTPTTRCRVCTRDRARPLGHLGRGLLRGGDDQQLGVRDQLGGGDRDVAGAGGQVEQQDVQVAPEHVGEELLQRAVQHRAPPDHRVVARGEHPDRDDLQPVRLRRHDHVVDAGGPGGDAQHARHRVAVDVGVDDADGQAAGGERGGQVHRHRRLADAALARRHAVHPRQRAGLGERDDGLGGAAAQVLAHVGALLVAHHVQLDAHGGDPGDARDGLGDPLGDRLPHRTAGDGEEHADVGDTVDHHDALDHARAR